MKLKDFLSRLENVKKCGDGYTARCPHHDDKENSLSISQNPEGKIAIFCHKGCEAVDVLNSMGGLKLQDLYPDSTRKHRSERKIAATYKYRDDTRVVRYEVVRYEPKRFAQRRPDPENPRGFVWNLKGVERLLYNLPELLEGIPLGRAVIVVEGEKDADRLTKLGFLATTNAGGAAKWNKKFSTVLSEAKHVFILPDNDDAGLTHARIIQVQIPRAIILPLDVPPKGDVSDWLDAGHTADELKALMTKAIESPPSLPELKPPSEIISVTTDGIPFECLGFNHGEFFILAKRQRQVRVLSETALSRPSTLMVLAPTSFWAQRYPKQAAPGFNASQASEEILLRCLKAGLYDPGRRRGRGAWKDKDRIIVHFGDYLLVDGVKTDLEAIESEYIYEAAPRLNLPLSDPLSTADAGKLIELTQSLCWAESISALLLAGWIVQAYICGISPWRPHVHITGPAGSGKTYVVNDILSKLLGNYALAVASASTEAGIRQALGSDSRPVIFDEFESHSGGERRIQSVIELARQASSENAASIVKGTVAGQSMRFKVRSCFCFSSIGVNLQNKADESRVCLLNLRASGSEEQFDRVKVLVLDICNPAYAGALAARSIQHAPLIIANMEPLSQALATRFGSKRSGDQFAALLAGYASLILDKPQFNLTEAEQFVEQLPFGEVTPDTSYTEERQCLDHLLSQKVKIEFEHRGIEFLAGDVLCCANDYTTSKNIGVSMEEAKQGLLGIGIRVEEEGFIVSNTMPVLRRIFRETPWGKHQEQLRRLPGAKPYKTAKYGGNHPSKGVFIPWEVVG